MTDKEKIQELENKLKSYEEDGVAKLYYSLNRKAAEMADLLNKSDLKTVDLVDGKDKTFERLKIIWNDAANIANAVRSMAETAGLTGDEKKTLQEKDRFQIKWFNKYMGEIIEIYNTKITLPDTPPLDEIEDWGMPAKEQYWRRKPLPNIFKILNRDDDGNIILTKEQEDYCTKEFYRIKNGFWFYLNGDLS